MFSLIARALKLDGVHKSYEGAIELHLPGYFGNAMFRIILHCYVLGPTRHYEWTGVSLHEALASANKDVTEWEDEVQAVESDAS